MHVVVFEAVRFSEAVGLEGLLEALLTSLGLKALGDLDDHRICVVLLDEVLAVHPTHLGNPPRLTAGSAYKQAVIGLLMLVDACPGSPASSGAFPKP
ncbi:bsr3897 [Bradyrhizobium diazoefficiens USDA 110]|uniref:Bsr3897 protein n=1 Tax=Bradyrhizobium diazoefficiens (strain JCM 10833 / BCRC 13528 / IAM 13628 / NBRC 14792 / USDA 110) TaxID=224911 RepID=Q89NE5_BRADU|nr:hypothetical protein CO678_13270 [Bradyrhizobium diazoefficiens]QBP27146.1 hypothetical protein Bdiaspc4_20165 [Bradyrhizobium diazoefficiens]BAC49162.1 bsr3897 [Bradyrhizobium diazoefficiens USDA 110]